MERIDRILQHKRFQECRQQIMQAEVHRIYCKHGLEHSMDVARIAYILSLENNEEGQALEKEIIYAMALLHDLGRSMEYRNGQSHHEAGVEIAGEILRDCGFTETEIAWITGAIAAHKYAETETVPEEPGSIGDRYRNILYRADKLSRNCFDCPAADTCYWPMEKRNHGIII